MTIFKITKHSQMIKDLESRISFIEGEIKVLRNDTGYHKEYISEMRQDIKDIKNILIEMRGNK